MQWLILEIIAYFANFAVVVFNLIIYHLPIVGEDMLNQKEVADDIYSDIENINDAKKELNRKKKDED
jgi:hypothetical protein